MTLFELPPRVPPEGGPPTAGQWRALVSEVRVMGDDERAEFAAETAEALGDGERCELDWDGIGRRMVLSRRQCGALLAGRSWVAVPMGGDHSGAYGEMRETGCFLFDDGAAAVEAAG